MRSSKCEDIDGRVKFIEEMKILSWLEVYMSDNTSNTMYHVYINYPIIYQFIVDDKIQVKDWHRFNTDLYGFQYNGLFEDCPDAYYYEGWDGDERIIVPIYYKLDNIDRIYNECSDDFFKTSWSGEFMLILILCTLNPFSKITNKSSWIIFIKLIFHIHVYRTDLFDVLIKHRKAINKILIKINGDDYSYLYVINLFI